MQSNSQREKQLNTTEDGKRGVLGVVGSSSRRIKFGAKVLKSSCEGIANEI